MRAVFAFFAAVSLYAAPSPELLACDSASCSLVTRDSTGVLPKKSWSIDVSFRHTDNDVKLQGTQAVPAVELPKIAFETRQVLPGVHQDLSGTDDFVQIDAAYGVASRTTLLLSLPLVARHNYDMSHFGFEGTYGTTGIGDALLGVRQSLGHGLVAGFSFQLPTGAHRDGEDYDGGVLDATLQPGTGAAAFVPSLLWGGRVAALRLSWSVTGFMELTTTNDLGYRFGDQDVVAATASRPIAASLTLSLQLKYSTSGRSQYLAQDVASTGSRIAYLNPGLRVSVGRGSMAYGYVLLPVYRDVNDTQLAPRYGLALGVSRTF